MATSNPDPTPEQIYSQWIMLGDPDRQRGIIDFTKLAGVDNPDKLTRSRARGYYDGALGSESFAFSVSRLQLELVVTSKNGSYIIRRKQTIPLAGLRPTIADRVQQVLGDYPDAVVIDFDEVMGEPSGAGFYIFRVDLPQDIGLREAQHLCISAKNLKEALSKFQQRTGLVAKIDVAIPGQ